MKKAFIRRIAATVAATTGAAHGVLGFRRRHDQDRRAAYRHRAVGRLKETQTKAINLAIEQINAAGGAAGKKLEPVFITYAGTPDAAVDGATRAVQKDGALFLTGMDTSAVSPALSAKLASLNALMVEVYAQADALTGKGCNPNLLPRQRQ